MSINWCFRIFILLADFSFQVDFFAAAFSHSVVVERSCHHAAGLMQTPIESDPVIIETCMTIVELQV